MTCIIYKDNTLYTDSLTTFGSEKEKTDDKVLIVYQKPYVVAYGLAGDAAAKWYAARKFPLDYTEVPEIPEGIQFQAIKVVYDTRTNTSRVYNLSTHERTLHVLEILAKEYAIGCGSPFARGAMMAGVSPVQALKITIECDAYCGNPIKIYPLKNYAKEKYAYKDCIEDNIINLLRG